MADALEAMRRPPNPYPLETMKNEHPLEAAIVAAWIAAEALLRLLAIAVAMVVLVAQLLHHAPVAPASVEAPPAPLAATEHPLTLVAGAALAQLEPLTVASLRRMARQHGLPRALSRSGRRDGLLAALTAISVATL